MSSSHWTFCVARPRFDTRLRKSAVESSASRPARSRERTWRKNAPRNAAPAPISVAISAGFVSAWRIPSTTKNMPTAERIAPGVSNGSVGSGLIGSVSLRVSTELSATTAGGKREAAARGLEKDGGAPADPGGDDAADERTGRGADAAEPADDAERAGPRGEVAE